MLSKTIHQTGLPKNTSYLGQQREDITLFKKEVTSDLFHSALLFGMSVVAVYYAPKIVNYLFFLVPLVLFWRSRKDYFWFGFYFILIDTPAHFFSETSATAVNRLPLYRFLPGLSFSVFDFFIIVSLAKALYYAKPKPFIISRPLRFVLIYIAFISLPMTFILGMDGFFSTARPYFYYLLLISFYYLVNNLHDIYKLGYMLLPILAFILLDQLYLITTGEMLVTLVDPYTSRYVVKDSVTGGTRAYFGGALIVIYTVILGIQLLHSRKYELFSGIAYVMIFAAIGGCILSGTRIYFLMPTIAMVCYLLHSRRGGVILTKFAIVSIVLSFILFGSGLLTVDYFVENIWPRFGTFFEAISGGNVAKFDTAASRIETDLPEVLDGISYSPLIGSGFSTIFRDHETNDLGFLNTILMLGVAGFFIFINFLAFLFIRLHILSRDPFADIHAQSVLLSVKVAFIGMMIGYATTYDFFTVLEVERIYFVCLLIASGEVAANSIQKRRKAALLYKDYRQGDSLVSKKTSINSSD